MNANSVSISLRHNLEKKSVSIASITDFVEEIQKTLHLIHNDMFETAQKRLQDRTYRLNSYQDMKVSDLQLPLCINVYYK